MGLAICRAVGLAINEAVSTGTDIAVGFFGLSMWYAVTSLQKC